MRRFGAFLIIAGLLSYIMLSRVSIARAEEEYGPGRVQVSVELPPEFMELGSGRLESRIKNIIPIGFTVEEIKNGTAILSGPRSQLSELEGSGLEVGEVDYISGGGRQAGRLARGADLAFRQNWGPLTYPGEIVTDIDIYFRSGEDEVAVGTRKSDWSQGKIYLYDYQGNELLSDTFPRGVDNLDELDIDASGSDGIYAITINSANTEGGIYFYTETGVPLGNWTNTNCGIDDTNDYDLDDDGSEEVIVKPEDYNTFYVLSHNGSLEWSATVADNITNINYQDLYGDGKYEVIVFSGDRTIPRGRISVFSPAGVLLGERNYAASDLDGSYAPGYAVYADLDGDGTEEIIPEPWYLDQKMEILSDSCSILATENLGRYVDDYYMSYDFNDDGNPDIALMTYTDSPSPETLEIQGFIGFNGAGFDTTWSYPSSGTINKDWARWGMDDERIAFATRDSSTFAGCMVYLLNTSDGTDWAGPVAVTGTVDDLEYRDLDNDGDKDVAILTNTYSDPTHTWTFYSYDQDLNLMVPGGHFTYQSDTGSSNSGSNFTAKDLNGDNKYELIPTSDKYLGSSAHVVAYTGVLKWSYSAPGPLADLDYYSDIDGDGNSDLSVISAAGGGGHLALLKDDGTSYGTIGTRSFADEIDYVSYISLDDRDGRELRLRFENSMNLSLYSYDLSHCFWSFTPSGDDIESFDYTDIDENDVSDLYLASNDTTTPTGYAYVFFGYALPNNPVLASGDYNGNGLSDVAVFRPSSGLWAVRGVTRVYFGGSSDLPVPGDYSGDGTSNIGIFRGSSGLWAIQGVTRSYFGSASDTAVPGDYDGDGQCDIGIFRESAGLWAIKGVTRVYFGAASDAVVPDDYNGNGTTDIGVFRSSTGLWALRGVTRSYFGGALDAPVPGDYNGTGNTGIGIFRPSSGLWAISGVTRAYFGTTEDTVVPGDYNGGGDDIGIFRGDSGLWAVRGVSRAYFGTSGDIPVAR